jgi:Right handed beta helix region
LYLKFIEFNDRRIMQRSMTFSLILSLTIIACCNSNRTHKRLNVAVNTHTENGYYVSTQSGDDRNPGTQEKPLKSIAELNLRLQKKVENIFLEGGQVYKGTLVLTGFNAKNRDPVKISSQGSGKAVINAGNAEAIRIDSCRNIWITDLDLRGNGRKEGSRTNGLSISHSKYCKIVNVTVSGFQKSGVELYDCSESEVEKVLASDNGFCGINIIGSARNQSHKIIVRNCKAENNPGDPTNLNNHSGNGILIGISDSVTIDHCSSTANGWDMPREGNGPVGIWTWESDHVTIQYCISYRNKTSKNAKDGGGFDLDGGVTNSLIQYCLSYENQGSGYGLFQYAGASPWSHNIIRYCVSINDAQSTEGAGSIFIWNGSHDSNQLTDCMIYNTVIYNSRGPLLSFETLSAHKNFIFCNNIFLGTDSPIIGNIKDSKFLGNDWWNISGSYKFMEFPGLAEWAKGTGQEIINGHFAGIQQDPELMGPFKTDITDPYQLEKLNGYKLKPDSPLRNKGLDFNSIFGLVQPDKDFYGNPIPAGVVVEPGIYKMK